MAGFAEKRDEFLPEFTIAGGARQALRATARGQTGRWNSDNPPKAFPVMFARQTTVGMCPPDRLPCPAHRLPRMFRSGRSADQRQPAETILNVPTPGSTRSYPVPARPAHAGNCCGNKPGRELGQNSLECAVLCSSCRPTCYVCGQQRASGRCQRGRRLMTHAARIHIRAQLAVCLPTSRRNFRWRTREQCWMVACDRD